MTVDRDLVMSLENLSMFALSEAERGEAQGWLQGMVDSFAPLDALDTAGVEPLTHVLPLSNVVREDCVVPSMENEVLLGNAARVRDGAFEVWRAVE